MSISRTAPCAHGMTSVVSTARTPVSSQIAISSALTPVESALVSSVMFPMPINLAVSVAPMDLRVALQRRREAESDRLDDGIDQIATPSIARARWGVGYLIDPVIEPIGFGFTASLERYAEIHRRYPDTPQLMGIGNITELTSADTTGVHALLLAIAEETGVRAVLTTEVIPWARGSVREIDVARRLMFHAVRHRTLPKNVDDRLVTVKDPVILEYDEAELRRLHAAVKDANFRIFTDRSTITVFNNELFVRGTDIQEIFAQLGVDEATHAFYLGRELAKAKLAITLGKTYRQEGALAWGYLTPPDDVRSEHVKLTQRRRRIEAPPKGRDRTR